MIELKIAHPLYLNARNTFIKLRFEVHATIDIPYEREKTSKKTTKTFKRRRKRRIKISIR